MKNLKNKLNKKGGFTLIEMLIVVAIIAILIAVSIPLVSSALERTKMATDAANERAAKAEIMIAYLAGEYEDGTSFSTGTAYVYDAVAGKLEASSALSTTTSYGKCTDNHKDKVIVVGMEDNGTVHMTWLDTTGTVPTITGGTFNASDWDQDLCMNEINN